MIWLYACNCRRPSSIVPSKDWYQSSPMIGKVARIRRYWRVIGSVWHTWIHFAHPCSQRSAGVAAVIFFLGMEGLEGIKESCIWDLIVVSKCEIIHRFATHTQSMISQRWSKVWGANWCNHGLKLWLKSGNKTVLIPCEAVCVAEAAGMVTTSYIQ